MPKEEEWLGDHAEGEDDPSDIDISKKLKDQYGYEEKDWED